MKGKHQYQKKSVDIVHDGPFGPKLLYGNNQVLMANIEISAPVKSSFPSWGHTLHKRWLHKPDKHVKLVNILFLLCKTLNVLGIINLPKFPTNYNQYVAKVMKG